MKQKVNIDLLIEQVLIEMQKETSLSNAELEYWREVLREKLERGEKIDRE